MPFNWLFITLNLTNAFAQQGSVDRMLSQITKMNRSGIQRCETSKSQEEICEFLDPAKRYKIQSLQSQASLMSNIQASPAIYIGETHEEMSLDFYSWVLERAKISGKRSCLTLEIDHSANEEVLKNCNANLEASFRINSVNYSRFEMKCPGVKDSIGFPAWRELAIQAFKLGWEVHAVDERSKCSNEVSLDSVACRNKYMAERVSDLRKSGCERTVSIFGKLHLVSDSRLKAHGVSHLVTTKDGAKSLLLELVPQKDLEDSFSKLNACGIRKQDYLILSGKDQSVPVNSAIGQFGSSSQFDSLILLPEIPNK